MRPFHQGRKQVEFAGRELLVLAALSFEAAAIDIEDPPFKDIPLPPGRRWFGRSRAPQDRTDPRNQLPQFEGFGQIVVCPELEADDPVDRITLAGEHDDWNIA